ncbi:MAG: hypothetical protein WBB70_12595, partial [Desulfobacterales bacterium]
MSEDYYKKYINKISNVIHSYPKSSEKTYLEEREKLWKEKHRFLVEIVEHSTQLMEVACKTSFTRSKERKKSRQFSLKDYFSIQWGIDIAKLKSISPIEDDAERITHVLKEILSDEYKTPEHSALIALHLSFVSFLYVLFPFIGDIP